MSTVPENAAHGCPGVESTSAGRSNACAGCPNQSVCSSGATQEDNSAQLVAERLKDVDTKIMILSGKGGVGKSTFTALLGRTLAEKYSEQNFGILDVDICGPSQPRMLGVQDELVHQSGSGWSPVYIEDNLSLMSIGFLLSSPDDAVIWRGPKKNGMIRQFLSEVDWGNLDVLLLDTPPGTSDEHLSATSYLKPTSGKVAAIVVTTPQEVALLDVRKEMSFCRKMNIPILGVVENMAIFECGKCKKTTEIFPARTGGARAMCKEMDVEFLGSLPLDPLITQRCDNGENFSGIRESALVLLREICEKIDLYRKT